MSDKSLEDRVRVVEQKLDANTATTVATMEKVEEVHETLIAIKGALKVFAWIAIGLKYITYVIGAIAASIGLYKLGADVPTRIDLPK